MKLIHLKLTNFQGISELEINLDGKSAAIYGDNATGKTTVFNAVTWLLFDKPSTGAKNWNPKPRCATGEIHNIDTAVSAVFSMADGSRVTLGKTMREVWKRKRGSASAEYSGNTVDYFLDGVPVKEREYTAAVARFCGGEETMKLLTMPDYFPEALDWRKRRELLLEICGDVTDEQVIDSTPELDDLPGYLLKPGTLSQYYTVDEFIKIAKARRADLNRQLDAIPNRIDEAKRAIPADLPNRAALDAELKTTASAIEELRRRIAVLQTGSDDASRAALAAAEAELAEARARHAKETNDALAGSYSTRKETERVRRDAERMADDLRAEAATKRRQAERLTNLRESILEEYRETAAIRFDPGDEICPTCGRRLPEDQIEALRGDFNQRRSEKLAAINERGRREASKDMIADLLARADALDTQAAEEEKKALDASEWLRMLIEAEARITVAFEDTDSYKTITGQIAQLQAAAAGVQNSVESQVQTLDSELQELLEREHELRGQVIRVETAERQKARVADLEAEEKGLASEFENVEHGVYLCEVFVRAKVAALTERINAGFRNVSFQLFTEQVNGGLNECCEVLVPSGAGAMVPYTTANHAARVNAGLEIVGTLAAHFNVDMPVIVDNAESVTHLIRTYGQVIRLVVSEEDKSLRVVVGDE